MECSQNDRSKTQYYVVILDRLQGRSRGLERALESHVRGPLTIDVLRHSEWQRHPGEADPDMAYRMLENAHRHIQAQPNTIPFGEVYYPYSQWDNTIEINGICYEVDWVG